MELKEQATTGIKWSAASQGSRQGVQLLTTLVLAHLLEPSDFGLLGMAMIVIGFVMLFRDLGTAAAIIQKKDLDEEILSSVFWANVIIGVAITVVLYLGAPLVASFFKEPDLIPVVRILSFSFLFACLGILQQSLLERSMAFPKLGRIEIASILVGSVVGITMALLGFGVYSLVCQSMSSIFINTLLLWMLNRWRPRLIFKWHVVKEIGGYSANLTAFNVLNYFTRSADYLIVGRFLGAELLGYYTIAYRLLLYPLQSIAIMIGRVVFPLYSQLQEQEERFQRAFLKITSSVALIMFPMMLGILAVARPFVYAAFDDQWGPVIRLIVILAPAAMLSSVLVNVGSIYKAKGRTDWMFRWAIVGAVVRVSAFIIGLRWGINGVAGGYTVAIAVLFYPTLAIPFRLIHLQMSRLLKDISMPLVTSVVMCAAVYLIEVSLRGHLRSGLTLGVCIAAGVGIYLILNLTLNRPQSMEVLGLLRRRQIEDS
jgi:O-antigen/teichoic acid export membrane protein